MLNKKKVEEMQRDPLPPARGTPTLMFEHMTLSELLKLRAQIDSYLPPTKLADIDMEAELVLQLHQVKGMLDDVINDGGTPANQKAQVANSITTILGQLSKIQTEMYDAERVKAMEAALIKTLESETPELKEKFLATYERHYALIKAAADRK
jgi:hypothetical protein